MAGITVLGKELPVDKAVSQTLTVVNTSRHRPVEPHPGAARAAGAGSPRPGVQTFLDTLPTIVVPATNLRVVAAPGKKTEGGGALTQHALDLSVSVAGQNLVDLTVGSATVGSAQVNCGGVADQALECTSRPIVLIDVLRRGKKVHLLGAANRRFAGRRVRIRFTATGKTVAPPEGPQHGPVHGHGQAPARQGPRAPTAPATSPRSASRRASGSSCRAGWW